MILTKKPKGRIAEGVGGFFRRDT